MTSTRTAVILASLVVIGVLIYLLAPILTPFLIAGLLAYIFNPIVVRLTRWHVPRPLAVLLVFLALTAVFLGLLLFLAPLAQQQVIRFAQNVPAYLDWVQQYWVPRIESLLGRPLPVDFNDIRAAVIANWEQIADIARRALVNVVSSGAQVALWLVNLALIPIVTFYLLLDWERLLVRTLDLFPPTAHETLRMLARRTDVALGSFLRGQLLVMIGLAAMYATGLWIVGLDLAVPIGLLAGSVSFVPYLGFVVGITAAGIAALLQFQDFMALAWVFPVFLVAQLVEGYVLTPRFVGSAIGLHPVAIIFSIMAGGQLFGFLGVLLALPAAAALKVWLGWLHASYITNEHSLEPKPRPRKTRPS